jgi:hypothetical protein
VSFLAYAFGAVVLILVLLRQARAVPVPRTYTARLPVVLGVLGLFAATSYARDHHVHASAWGWLLATLVVGAVGVGALRGWSMRVWSTNGWVLRQGTVTTMALWLLSLVVHLAGTSGGTASGAAGLVGASFLLYLGLTLGVQYYVVHRRAQPLWVQLGPDAGRSFFVNLTQGPGVFFTTFRGEPGQPGQAPGWNPAAGHHGADVIDVEVVEDDEEHGPPQLHGPH